MGINSNFFYFRHFKGGRELETEIEAEYIVGGMAFDVHSYFLLHILNYRKY
jgi:hypothetical protein